MSSWKDLNYYIEEWEKQEKLKEWGDQGRKIIYNLELPFRYAGYSNLFIDRDASDPAIRKFLYESREFSWLGWPYTDKVVCDAIRVGLYWSLKEHHRNRTAVEKILWKVFSNGWAKQYQNSPENIVTQVLIERIRSIALSHT